MIREHPRFQKTAMIFISAIQVSDIDRLRGYEMGAVDYVPVPVVPEVLRAKIKVFAELYRKTRAARAAQRRARGSRPRPHRRAGELHRKAASKASSAAAWRSPPARWDPGTGTGSTATGCGTRASTAFSASTRRRFKVTSANVQALLHPDDVDELRKAMAAVQHTVRTPMKRSFASSGPMARSAGASARRRRPSTRAAAWCASAASPSTSPNASAPRSARTCWPAKSITAPRTRWRWRNRSCA